MVGEALSPLMEGPDPDGGEGERKRVGSGLGHWMRGQLSRAPSVTSLAYKRSDLRLLLGVMGAPLAPVHVSTLDPLPHLSIKDTPIVNSLSVSFSLAMHKRFLFLFFFSARFNKNQRLHFF